MLVDYGSESDSGSPPPVAVKANLPPVEEPVSDGDGDEGEVDPSDGFGIANLTKEQQHTATSSSSSSALAVKSAPDVVVNVSRIGPAERQGFPP